MGPCSNRTGVLLRELTETPEISLSPSAMLGYREKVGICKLQRVLSPETKLPGYLSLGLRSLWNGEREISVV